MPSSSSSSPSTGTAKSPPSSAAALSYWELCKAYNLHESYCAPATTQQPQRAKCRPFPNCLHGLKAKRGVHATPPPLLRSLGADPAARVRRVGQLVGLSNLGATCYLGTLLQCLFMNSHFRHTLYLYRSPHRPSLASPSSGDTVVLLLQQLFGLLEYGPQLYESPEAIVNELNLNRYVQQDVNEFNNLFLSSLEGCLKECGGEGEVAERVRRLITSEFTGETVSTVTSLCGHISQRPSSFVDVSLLIRGKKTLTDCLDAFIEAEQLMARNAYYCTKCQGKREAAKQTRFSSLPPVLNLQLIRFHYDVESGQKKKLNDRIFLPYRLNMQPYMAPTDDSTLTPADRYQYELTAVLRHKGASAHRGHYTCEVRDAKGKWWIFDDEKVGLGGDTFNARGDAAAAQVRVDKENETSEKDGGEGGAGKTKGGKRKRKGQSLTMKKQRRVDKEEEAKGQSKVTDYMDRARREAEDDDDVVMVDAEDSERGNDKKDDKESERDSEDVVLDEKREVDGQRKGIDGDWSSNAYMLVYTLQSRVLEDARAAEEASQRRANSPQREEEQSQPNSNLTSAAVAPPSFICDCHTDCRPPLSVKKAIETSAAKLNDDIRSYGQRKTQLMDKIEQRRAEVDELLDSLDAPPITQRTAAEYEQHHRLPNQLSPHRRPVRRRRREQVVLDNEVVELSDGEEEEDVEAVAEPFNFIHVGWLQRWLNGQTEREWSDEMAERAVTEARGRGAKAVIEGGDKGDAIVVDGDEEGGEKDARESPVQQDGNVIVLSDEDDQQRSSSPTNIVSTLTSSSPSRSSASPTSASSTSHFDTDDPLWPGDIFESCARLLCPHGKLDPRLHKQRLTKRISSTAWSRLVKENATAQRERSQFLVDAGLSCPPEPRTQLDLDDSSLCAECVLELQNESSQLSAQRVQYEALVDGMKEFTHMAARSTQAFKSGQLSHTGMLLDREWYKQFADQVRKWKAKAYSSVLLPSTNPDDINKGLICPHGNLRVRTDLHAFLISPQLWKSFADHYPNSTTFAARTDVCDVCEAADEEDLSRRQQLSTELTREQDKYKFGNLLRQRHDLFPDPKRPPHSTKPNQPYYLLPARWVLHKFLPYHEQATVDSTKPLLDRPPPAPMHELFCEHNKLKLNPVPKGVLGGELEGIDKGEVTFCEATAWRGLVEGKYVESELSVTMSVRDVVDDDAFLSTSDAWLSVIVELNPQPCEMCIKVRQQQDHDRLHHFTRGSLTVRRVPRTTPIGSAPTAGSPSTSAEQPASSSSASPSRFTTPSPTSPRSRSRRKRAYTTLEEMDVYDVDCTDDVATLKMKISQYCSHNPAHMRLFWRENEMMEGKKLSEYGVTDGGELIMKVDTEAADTWAVDYMDYLPTDDTFVSGDVESGFAGTRLGGGTEGKKAPKTKAPPPASTAVAEIKEENEAKEDNASSANRRLSNTAAEMDESKEEAAADIASAERSSNAIVAPILPRMDDTPPTATARASLATTTTITAVAAIAPVPATSAAPAAGTTPAAAASPPSKSPFLATLLEKQRQKAPQARSAAPHSYSEETKDEAAAAVVAHSEEDDLRIAREMQESFDQEAKQQTASSRRAAAEHVDRQRRMVAAEEERRAQEKDDHAMALKLSQRLQLQQRQAVMEGEAGGGPEDEERMSHQRRRTTRSRTATTARPTSERSVNGSEEKRAAADRSQPNLFELLLVRGAVEEKRQQAEEAAAEVGEQSPSRSRGMSWTRRRKTARIVERGSHSTDRRSSSSSRSGQINSSDAHSA